MWKFLLPFAAFVALVVLFAFGLNPNRDIHALPSPLIGKPAPEFALTDVLDPTRHGEQCGAQRPGLRTQCLGHLVRGLSRGAGGVAGDRTPACRAHHRAGLPRTIMTRRSCGLRSSAILTPPVPFDGDGRTAIDWGVYGAPETYLVDTPRASNLQVHLANDARSMGKGIPAANRCRPERRMIAISRAASGIGAAWHRRCVLRRCAGSR